MIALGLAVAFAQDAPTDIPAEPVPVEARVELAEADLEAQLAELQERIERSEARLAEAEARLSELDTERALGALEPSSATTGGIVVSAGETLPEAVAIAGPVEIHGRVLGAAVSFGSDVIVHHGAHVEGDAVSFGGEVVVRDGGVVDGNRVTLGGSTSQFLPAAGVGAVGQNDLVTGLARKLVLMLALAGAGVMVVGMFPRHVDNVAQQLEKHPITSVTAGFVLLPLAALLMLFFTVTIAGVPVALFLAVLMALAAMLGFVGLCQAAGDKLPLGEPGTRRWLAFLVGVIALTFVGQIPWVGWLVAVPLGLAGLGAAMQTRLGTRDIL